MTKRRVSRRAVLGGLGGALVGLPLLEHFAGREAEAALAPKRIVFVTTPNGTNPATHWPTGSGSSFSLSSLLAPLADYQDRMVVLRGVDNLAAKATGLNGHTDTVRCMLTGRKASNQDPGDYTAAGGISVDQHIANDVGADTVFKSLEYVTSYIYAHPPNYSSFYGANQPAPFEDEPDKLFDRVFGELDPQDSAAADALRADRQSVLHGVYAEYKALDARLGKADRERLAAHLDQVKDLEQKVLAQANAACALPPKPDSADSDAGLDVLAHALACDLTRVASVRLCFWDSYAFLGLPGSYHDDYLHHVTSDPQAAAAVDQVKTYQAGLVKGLIDKLAAIPEGSGTLFDNTLVVWADEFCHGYAHAHHEVPYVLFCGSDRFFEMGRYLHYATAVSNNRLWNSLVAAMGATGAGDFGDPQYDNTPLPELV